jgi:branched-chain amino acid transport system ATP-binding protein
VDGLPPYRRCHKGLGRTFQIPRVFDSLSVGENVMIGGSFGRGAHPRGDDLARQVDDVLELSGLATQRDTPAGLVDLLTRKLIMLAAVIATGSKLVLMDEPLAGLNAEETDRYVDLVLRLQTETGVTFAMVEHKIRTLTRVCDRIMIMNFGRVLCLDTPQAVVRDQRVIDAYLGEQFDA